VCGTDPRDFGGTDLVKRLGATGPAAQGSAASAAPSAAEKKDDGYGYGVWWVIGLGLVAGIGIGFLYSGRRNKGPQL
jgi:alkylation response protein AidB-like acyl-CoA dehydrogenase